MKLVDSVARIETKLEGLVGLHSRVDTLENESLEIKSMVKGGWKVLTAAVFVLSLVGSAALYVVEIFGARAMASVGAVIFKAH